MTKPEKHEERGALRETGPQQVSLARSPAGQLSQGEQHVPTTGGMGEMERSTQATRPRHAFLRVIGPGLLSGT